MQVDWHLARIGTARRFINKANEELDGMVELLEGEGIFVRGMAETGRGEGRSR